MASYDENRAGIPGLGTHHPSDACAFCGTRWGLLNVVTIRSTQARGLVCDDLIACERRRNRRKQMRLDVEGAA